MQFDRSGYFPGHRPSCPMISWSTSAGLLLQGLCSFISQAPSCFQRPALKVHCSLSSFQSKRCPAVSLSALGTEIAPRQPSRVALVAESHTMLFSTTGTQAQTWLSLAVRKVRIRLKRNSKGPKQCHCSLEFSSRRLELELCIASNHFDHRHRRRKSGDFMHHDDREVAELNCRYCA